MLSSRFTVNIKLKSIAIAVKSLDVSPTKAKIYINQENVDFSIVEEFKADQVSVPVLPIILESTRKLICKQMSKQN